MSDFVGLDKFLAELKAAPGILRKEVKAVVKKTGIETERSAKKLVRAGLAARGFVGGGSYLPHYAKSIGFDIESSGYRAVVGPDADLIQGSFGRGVEFGSSRTGPIAHMLPAFDEQEPLFVSYMTKAAEKAL